MISKQSNLKYDSLIPFFVGDRRYGQDIIRDFWSGVSHAGAAIAGLVGADTFLLKGGIVTQGASVSLIDIEALSAIINTAVDIPDDFATLPPAVITADISIPVEGSAQSDVSLSGATLDGATINYVKVAHAVVDGNTRTRAKKAGSYSYEVQPSVTFTITSTAPTSYELELAQLVGDGSTFLTITDTLYTANITNILSDLITSTIIDSEQIVATTRFKRDPYKIEQVPGSATLDKDASFGGNLAALNDTDFVFANSQDEDITVYRFDGTNFTQIGNTKSLPNGGVRSITTLSPTRIALTSPSTALYYVYDWDGTDFTQVGSTTATGDIFTHITGCTSNRIASISGSNNTIRMMEFDGSIWSQVGNTIARTNTNGRLAALSSNLVAYVDTIDENVRIYSFDDTNWSNIATQGISSLSNTEIVALNSTDFILTDSTLAWVRIYRYEGGEISMVGSSFTLANGTKPVTALTSKLIMIYERTPQEVNAYQIVSSTIPPLAPFKDVD